jgi:hypothetical protein
MKVSNKQIEKIKASAAIQLGTYASNIQVSSVEKAFLYTGENWVTAWVLNLAETKSNDLKEVRVRLS